MRAFVGIPTHTLCVVMVCWITSSHAFQGISSFKNGFTIQPRNTAALAIARRQSLLRSSSLPPLSRPPLLLFLSTPSRMFSRTTKSGRHDQQQQQQQQRQQRQERQRQEHQRVGWIVLHAENNGGGSDERIKPNDGVLSSSSSSWTDTEASSKSTAGSGKDMSSSTLSPSTVTPTSSGNSKNNINTNTNNSSSNSGGITKTLLLAVPLFCKFVIVLAIKFMTDLVVFPLLYLYRLARLTKRNILQIWSGRNSGGGNNNNKSSNTGGTSNGITTTTSSGAYFEGLIPNGATSVVYQKEQLNGELQPGNEATNDFAP